MNISGQCSHCGEFTNGWSPSQVNDVINYYIMSQSNSLCSNCGTAQPLQLSWRDQQALMYGGSYGYNNTSSYLPPPSLTYGNAYDNQRSLQLQTNGLSAYNQTMPQQGMSIMPQNGLPLQLTVSGGSGPGTLFPHQMPMSSRRGFDQQTMVMSLLAQQQQQQQEQQDQQSESARNRVATFVPSQRLLVLPGMQQVKVEPLPPHMRTYEGPGLIGNGYSYGYNNNGFNPNAHFNAHQGYNLTVRSTQTSRALVDLTFPNDRANTSGRRTKASVKSDAEEGRSSYVLNKLSTSGDAETGKDGELVEKIKNADRKFAKSMSRLSRAGSKTGNVDDDGNDVGTSKSRSSTKQKSSSESRISNKNQSNKESSDKGATRPPTESNNKTRPPTEFNNKENKSNPRPPTNVEFKSTTRPPTDNGMNENSNRPPTDANNDNKSTTRASSNNKTNVTRPPTNNNVMFKSNDFVEKVAA